MLTMGRISNIFALLQRMMLVLFLQCSAYTQLKLTAETGQVLCLSNEKFRVGKNGVEYRLPGEVGESPSLELFQRCMDMALMDMV